MDKFQVLLEVPREIIRNKQVVTDYWQVLRLTNDQDVQGQSAETVHVPDGFVIVPLAVWKAQREILVKRKNIAVWLASSERAEELRNDTGVLPLIAVDFPKFTDGRGYSIAFNLRSRLGYQGELRAIGDVLRDQLFYMQRVGFNSFATRADRDIHDALKGLTDFSETYQASVEPKLPLFQREDRRTISA